MRVVVQRVKEASVISDGVLTGKIGKGLMVLFAVHKEDTKASCKWMAQKLANLRLFSDEAGKMNLSVRDVGGEILVVSQFTLYASCLRGRRPDFVGSAPGDVAEEFYDEFVDRVSDEMGDVQTGKFGAMMEVSLVNDGPVTFIIDHP